ncbi:MAG: glycosyltransferase family 2 protein [Caldilineaceae bacterium]
MTVLYLLFSIATWSLGFILSAVILYLLFLTITALASHRQRHTLIPVSQNRFVFLVPAHNEEKLLPNLLKSLKALDYPADQFAIHVVADNCADCTAEVGRAHGAHVHERFNQTQLGKGYALQWLLKRIEESDDAFDAAIILDADSVVSANFLSVMNRHLANGERVIQAYYTVLHPERAWNTCLRYVALTALHYLRPLARMALGGSVGLKGNGMVFHRSILRNHAWSASVTEDIEYHMSLILAGERVTFAREAVVWAEMPTELKDARTQNIRWEQGRLEMAKRYVPRLLKAFWSGQQKQPNLSAFTYLDAAIEHIIPPFSIVTGLSLLFLFMALLLQSTAAIALGMGLLIGQIVYFGTGLLLVNSPRQVYVALLYAPLFVVWKIWLYLRILLGLDKQGWVRTARNNV